MATNIGPKIGIDGEAEYRKQINQIIQQAKTLDSEMKAVTSSFAANATQEEKNAKTSGLLGQQIKTQMERINLLSKMLQESSAKYGENDEKTLKWKQAVNSATAELNNMIPKGNEVEKTTEKVAKEFDQAGKKGISFGDILKANVISDVIVSGLHKVADAAIGISKAFIGFGKDAVVAFAELQQNLGGSEAVFGEYAEVVQVAAESAYKAMGTTQSQYLATANKMGALFQGSGLDAQRSMELTTQAMQRAADMASVMGIDTADALEAVSGAAKGNYTMMDNLGVAMNATTLDAYALANGYDKAFSKMSNAEKAEVAMKYFFENTSQYANNFEKEASSTVSGSIGMLQAAVQTWVAGLGNSEADIVKLTGNIVDAFQTAAQNVVPVVENIVGALPEIVGAVVPAITGILPTALSVGTDILEALAEGILSAIPSVAAELPKVLVQLVEFILSALPKVLNAAAVIVVELAKGIAQALPELIPAAVDAVLQLVETLIDNIDLIIDAGIDLLLGLTEGILGAVPQLLARLPEIIVKLVNTLMSKIPDIIRAGVKILTSLVSAMPEIINGIVQALPVLISGLINGLLSHLPEIIDAGVELLVAIVSNLPQIIKTVVGALPDIISAIVKGIRDAWPQIKKAGADLFKGLWEGIKSVGDWLWRKVKGLLSGLTDKIKGFFGIHSPSKLFEDEIGVNLAKGIGVGFADEMPDITADMTAAMPRALNASTTNMGGVTITVNGAPGQDVGQLANLVAVKIQNMVNRKEAVFA